ncbi:SDR family NAD(P)-dependent oxidoreductase [Actinoallomurus iriomotensis]|uniref:Uncharacterized protein n=1 Tax=Actinoallomurus iriomotensis TaxID=478107 RepID=A0A9W6S0H9_9ACTN|nr:SDR family NAD(P)-dependent oxidoreductase [Actinoallomurus iriomotensis]GLY83185.1 hypothetical protein Airi02_011150 [Actinoallomurus iriomotensis]
MTAITGKIVLITGANRDIGRALLEEALRRGAQQVHAGTRESLLARSRGAIVNNASVAAFAPLPVVPAYSISKAAAFSLTQA